MRLEPLYLMRLHYPEGWSAGLSGGHSEHFMLAEGSVEGRIRGRVRGANLTRRRPDGTDVPEARGVIETQDGATLLFELRGVARTHVPGRRQVTGSVTHVSDDTRYTWLNDVVCVLSGEVRSLGGSGSEIVLQIAELVWVAPHDD